MPSSTSAAGRAAGPPQFQGDVREAARDRNGSAGARPGALAWRTTARSGNHVGKFRDGDAEPAEVIGSRCGSDSIAKAARPRGVRVADQEDDAGARHRAAGRVADRPGQCLAGRVLRSNAGWRLSTPGRSAGHWSAVRPVGNCDPARRRGREPRHRPAPRWAGPRRPGRRRRPRPESADSPRRGHTRARPPGPRPAPAAEPSPTTRPARRRRPPPPGRVGPAGAKSVLGPDQPAVDGRHRTPEFPGRLGVRPPFDHTSEQQGPVVRRQPGEFVLQVGARSAVRSRPPRAATPRPAGRGSGPADRPPGGRRRRRHRAARYSQFG